MTRIITHNNTRYRTTGKTHWSSSTAPPSEWDFPVATLRGNYVSIPPHPDGWAGAAITQFEQLEPLPFIPDWPGHRPEQYLANSHDQPNCPVKRGDLLLFQKPLDWSFVVRATDEPTTLGFLLEVTTSVAPHLGLHGCAYLIRRANPEHDAEDAP